MIAEGHLIQSLKISTSWHYCCGWTDFHKI